ncbi:MAG: hypothetical protein IPL79_20320 [Myxococcales bacterium]|nr:hypothetical protein [Myxococcales bacterium]
MARRPTNAALSRQQRRIIRELMAKHEPAIQAAFEAAIQNAKGALDFDALIRAVEANDWRRVDQLFRLNQAVLFPLEDAARAALIAGGVAVAVPKGIAGAFSFNGRHVRAEQIIAETGARLVTEIGNPGEDVIRAILLDGQQEGIGARKVAQRLGGVVNPRTGIREGGIMGLDGPRAHRLDAVTRGMKTPEGVRDLVTVRADGSLKLKYKVNPATEQQIFSAYKRGEAVPAAARARAEKQFSNKLLKERSETIARNEAFKAQAQGRNEAHRQMMEGGLVESADKKWLHNTAKNPRHDHQSMDGKVVAFDEAFAMDDGTQMQFPHDPAAGPEHVIGCRCVVIYQVRYKRPGG